ncbi:hypothetical protein Q73_07380 [Bacillus coahuilensis m2-6]|nr:hypothetical protein Q73_07380 [Bacillus coahuilensis m2-6]
MRRGESMQREKLLLYMLGIGLFGLFVWGFVEIIEEWKENEIKQFDDTAFHIIHSTRTGNVTEFMSDLTQLGGITWIVLMVIIVAMGFTLLKEWKSSLFILLTNGLGGAFNWLLKEWFKRDRPALEQIVEQGGYSFPSGHTMGSTILYGSIAYVFYRILKNKWAKVGIVFFSIILFLMVGVSRIYLGVHFASDVIGGITAGGAWLLFSIFLFNVLEWRKKIID